MLNRSHPCWTPQQVGYLAHRRASAQQEWKLWPLASGAARKRHEESTLRYIPEPFKIKMVEPIKMTTREEREGFIRSANYNAFSLSAEDVYIDLQTDSGTGAMSDSQWAAVMRGDESYSGGRSYYKLLDAGKEIFDYEYIQPVHQGRAAEKILFPLLVTTPGQYVISNMFFDTTRAHVGLAGGRAVDCVCPEGLDSAAHFDFKGNMDVPKLASLIEQYGAGNVAAIVMTTTNNSVGGEAAYKDVSPIDITREMFSYADVFTMSAKKDALVNMGGLLGVREDGALVEAIKT